MADRHFASSPAKITMRAGTDICPRVADLIDYALGQLSGDDRQRVADHLNQQEECSSCRGWVEKAAQFRAAPMMNGGACGTLTPAPAFCSAPLSVNDPTPIPPSSRFQRQALLDLEE